MATLMATETESWECMADSTPRSESVDMSRIIVSYSDSATGSLSRSASRGIPIYTLFFMLSSNCTKGMSHKCGFVGVQL